MTQVFLSYDRRDHQAAERMARELELVGVHVWWDRSSLEPGEPFEDAIDRAIEEADQVIVLWSEASVRSSWVRAEAREGLTRGILVPVLLENTRPPLTFRGLHTLDLTSWASNPTRGGLPDDLVRACQKYSSKGFGCQYDVTFCIDLHSSMEEHLRRIKREALEFQPKLVAAAAKQGKIITYQSIKLVAYSSLGGPMFVTRFIDLLTEEDEFVNTMTGLKVEKEPANDDQSGTMGLKALELAIRGPWPRVEAPRVRQIIIVWTDRASNPGRAGGYGSVDFDELTDLWEVHPSPDAKRLVLFAPDHGSWAEIGEYWDNVISVPSAAGNGGSDSSELQEIINAIVNSV